MSSKIVSVYIHDDIVEDLTLHIFQMNGHWTANVLDTARLLSKLQMTKNSAINTFSVYEDRVVFRYTE